MLVSELTLNGLPIYDLLINKHHINYKNYTDGIHISKDWLHDFRIFSVTGED